ncbi:MAG TPA: PCRF domain-containing protein, partial [Patescibacteria group bacterium]|nr:PCRF domain-containing protein [Patescibacteria group bacterium]
MQDLLKQIKDLKLKIKETKEALNIESKKKNLKNLSDLMIQTDFWSDRKRAINISQEAENLKEEIESFENLAKALKDMEDLISLAQEYDDDSLKKDLDFRFRKILQDFSRLEFLLLFSDDLDNNNAIISIHAGTGGVDAQDFAEKLERLYLRWAEKKKFSVEIIDRSVASEAGIKSTVFKISGPYVYGRLKGENGVHRLVRISPFDAEKMRHTSFAGVEVIPELKDSEQVEIKDSDLKIDVFKSSGPGGQSVNT